MSYPVTPEYISDLRPNEVFVFGSNLAGRHGKGAAKQAMRLGAIRGVPEGLSGQTYAIPTKDFHLDTLPIEDIRESVGKFLAFAATRKDLVFLVTKIGCGLAGYSPSDIAPLFHECRIPLNVHLPESFWRMRNRPDTANYQPYSVLAPEDEIGENGRPDCD